MRTLVIPDVHTKFWLVERILKEPHDQAVWLGDFFDDWGDTPEIAEQTALALMRMQKESKKDDVFLLGNHDGMYLWPEVAQKLACSGFTPAKAKAIKAAINVKEVRQRFKLHTTVDGWLLSHAGLHVYHRNPRLMEEQGEILKDLAEGRVHMALHAGRSRGGNALHGGINWLDWREFEPIEGVRQICGHTQGAEVRQKGENYCIDTGLRNYAVIEDGRVEIKETPRG